MLPDCLGQIAWLSQQNGLFAATLAGRDGIKNVRCLGTILAFEISSGKDGYLNNIGSVITQASMAQGVYLRPLGNTVYIMPPYCTKKEELEKIYHLLTDIIGGLGR